MPINLGSGAISAAKIGSADVAKVMLGANAVYTASAPPAQVTGLAVDSTGDGTTDLSWTAPASDATITDYSVEYTYSQPLTGVALLAPFDSDLDDVLGITATAVNTPTITSGGNFSGYADLGAADKLTYSSVSFGSGDYTVEFWVLRTESSWAPNGGNPLLELPGVAMLGRVGTDTLGLYEDDFGSWAAVSGTTTSSIDQDWHHVALVRDGNTLRLYLDGSQVGTMSTSSNPSSVVFGASSIYGCRFGLDDLRVSTSAVYPSGTAFTPPATAHPTSGGGTTATVLVGSAATGYQLTGLTNDTEYSVRVAAVSAAGTGAYSTAVTATPTASSAAGGGTDPEPSLTSAAYVQSFGVITNSENPNGFAISRDGSVMFVSALKPQTIAQYNLSTAFDISTASYASSMSTSGQDTYPAEVAVSDDGANLYVLGYNSDTVYQYAMSTTFALSTASYASKSFSFLSQGTKGHGVGFSDSGSKMYIADSGNNAIYQYNLSTAWDVLTASYSGNSFSVATQTVYPYAVEVSQGGGTMLVASSYGTHVGILEYALSTAYDVSTASYTQAFSTSSQGQPQAVRTGDSSTRLYIVEGGGDTVRQYSL